MTRVERLGLATALPIGIAIGVLDAHAEEVQPAVLLYLIAGAALGILAPRLALPVGILLGLGVPIVHAYIRINHLPLPYAMDSYASGFLALIPPTIGALGAAWLLGWREALRR
jgi:lipopolysaccharide export LptBFGC system permease protein LptF